MERRIFLLSSLAATLTSGVARASPIDPRETFVLRHDDIRFVPWTGLPAGSGEMAKLYGDFDKPGPYLVMMKWNPGWFSAPHSYATARTFDYDGVPAGVSQPVIVAVFGMGPVDIELADPKLPPWRHVA